MFKGCQVRAIAVWLWDAAMSLWQPAQTTLPTNASEFAADSRLDADAHKSGKQTSDAKPNLMNGVGQRA